MGDLDRRIASLEASFASHDGGGGGGAREGEKIRRKFMHAAFDAIAHIRRAPIDEPRWGYGVEKLREKDPFTVAAYVAALTAWGHEDLDEARVILQEVVDEQGANPAILDRLIDILVDVVAEVKRRRDERRSERERGSRWEA